MSFSANCSRGNSELSCKGVCLPSPSPACRTPVTCPELQSLKCSWGPRRPRVWIWQKGVDQSHRPEERRGWGGGCRERGLPLHVAACPGLPGRGGTLGTSTGEPSLVLLPHLTPPLTPAGPGSSSHVHQPAWLGLQRAAVASGQSWPGLHSSLRPVSNSSHAVASPRETGGRPWKASAGDTGEDWRGVSLP